MSTNRDKLMSMCGVPVRYWEGIDDPVDAVVPCMPHEAYRLEWKALIEEAVRDTIREIVAEELDKRGLRTSEQEASND